MKLCVPATSANLGSGFDVFGMALELFNEIEFSSSDSFRFTNTGTYGREIDTAPFFQMVFERFENLSGHIVPPLNIIQRCEIPPARGFGSSAAAVAAALIIANETTGTPLSTSALIDMGVAIEGHPDNIVPCFTGGLVVSHYVDGVLTYERFEIGPTELVFLVPAFQLSTEKMRQVLPKTVRFEDALYNLKNATQFVSKIARGNFVEALKYTGDRLHQSNRINCVKNMQELMKEIEKRNPEFVFVSGSGSAICCKLSDYEDLPGVERVIRTKVYNTSAMVGHD